MTEAGYQKKIIDRIEAIGGVAVNGTYYKAGIADLICGFPINGVLHHLHVEVKTKKAYEELMAKHISEFNGLYVVDDSFKGREKLQAFKLNEVRKRGGLALFAYDFKQVDEYIERITNV